MSRSARGPVWPRRVGGPTWRAWRPCPHCGLLVRTNEFNGEVVEQPRFYGSEPLHYCPARLSYQPVVIGEALR